jgi:hypothetical protein
VPVYCDRATAPGGTPRERDAGELSSLHNPAPKDYVLKRALRGRFEGAKRLEIEL